MVLVGMHGNGVCLKKQMTASASNSLLVTRHRSIFQFCQFRLHPIQFRCHTQHKFHQQCTWKHLPVAGLPWYDLRGWLGIKKQLSIYLTRCCHTQHIFCQGMHLSENLYLLLLRTTHVPSTIHTSMWKRLPVAVTFNTHSINNSYCIYVKTFTCRCHTQHMFHQQFIHIWKYKLTVAVTHNTRSINNSYIYDILISMWKHLTLAVKHNTHSINNSYHVKTFTCRCYAQHMLRQQLTRHVPSINNSYCMIYVKPFPCQCHCHTQNMYHQRL